jgi:hypothetical protein
MQQLQRQPRSANGVSEGGNEEDGLMSALRCCSAAPRVLPAAVYYLPCAPSCLRQGLFLPCARPLLSVVWPSSCGRSCLSNGTPSEVRAS